MTLSNDKIKFISFHQPSLPDGNYELKIKQQVKINGKEFGWGTDKWTDAPEAQLKFSIAGPRFKIDQELIQSQFPPPKSIGEYYNVLPQIIFSRTTLPWERTIDNTDLSNTDAPKPWMALLLFDANDPVTKTKLTLDELINSYEKSAKPDKKPEFVKILPRNSADTPKNGELKLEAGQQPQDRLTVIDVPKQLLWKILPSEKEIKNLAHIKEGISATDPLKKAEYPLVFGSRLPAPGTSSNKKSTVGSQSVVHLVSLESRKLLLDELRSKPSDNNLVRLVSLARWSFSTFQRSKTFSGWLREAWCPDDKRTDTDGTGNTGRSCSCTPNTLNTLRMPRSSNTDVEAFLSQGYVPIQHQTRHGNHLVSWYRSPLLPGTNKSTGSNVTFPILSSDKLVRYLSDVDMFDTTYAAAWELGRMLTLRSKRVSTLLFNWKRTHAQKLLESEKKVNHLPFAPDSEIMPDFPKLLKEWFDELLMLKHIPFHYLVPSEEMLPANSIRFFNVDTYWMESILDGAFSIGRVSSADADRDISIRNSSGHIPEPPVCSGFLLRSPVISGWPHLGVEAYTEVLDSDPEKKTSQARCLRMDRLGNDVLICLFEGDIQTVDIHEHPETVHFCVDTGDDPNNLDQYFKKLRGTNKTVTDSFWKKSSKDKRVINIAELVNCANAPNAAEFGFSMIEGVERVRFIKK